MTPPRWKKAHWLPLPSVAATKSTEYGKRLADRDSQLEDKARAIAAKLQRRQKYVRALFSGGTFCSEAQVIFRGRVPDLYSNVPIGSLARLKDNLHSQKHTFLDLGEDEFTAGRLHPMIDFSMRNRRMRQEAEDPETALILLDLVLGYGANKEPLAEIIPVIRACRKTAVKSGRLPAFARFGNRHRPGPPEPQPGRRGPAPKPASRSWNPMRRRANWPCIIIERLGRKS